MTQSNDGVSPSDASVQPSPPALILASASKSRAQLLLAAGVPHRVIPANVDEGEVKRSLTGEGAPSFAIAETLAELKAQQISRRQREALVIGADQVLDCGGQLFDKPPDLDHARAHLMALRGRRHTLLTSVCVVRDGTVIWHHNEQAHLEMRDLSDTFIEWYIGQTSEQICDSVGAYKLEGLGAQLFARVDGDFFTILGLPLLPLLDVLRNHGVVPT